MSGFSPGPPTIAEFQYFLQDIAGIAPVYLPTSPVPAVVSYAFYVAVKTVLPALRIAGIYNAAVYNLATSIVIHLAQDQAGQNYFAKLRASYNIGGKFFLGVVSASSDQATSVSILNPDFAKTLSLSNLQQLQDPYGQQYLAWAMDYGTVWTLS